MVGPLRRKESFGLKGRAGAVGDLEGVGERGGDVVGGVGEICAGAGHLGGDLARCAVGRVEGEALAGRAARGCRGRAGRCPGGYRGSGPGRRGPGRSSGSMRSGVRTTTVPTSKGPTWAGTIAATESGVPR